MADLSTQIFNGRFDIPASFKINKDASASSVRAIIYEGFDPGSEAGKGVTRPARGIEANFGRIILQKSEVADKPPVHSILNDGTDDWDILSADDTRVGTWRCTAKKTVRGRGHKR